jgi:hypothetical protein
MTAEPRSKQKHVGELYELVVLNYMMSTHIAALSAIALGKNPPAPSADYDPVAEDIISNIGKAITATDRGAISKWLTDETAESHVPDTKDTGNTGSDERSARKGQGIVPTGPRPSLAVVKSVSDQFNFIWKISEDLVRILRA